MVACHTIWCMEQPKGSETVLPRHPRFEWLCNHVLYDFQLYSIQFVFYSHLYIYIHVIYKPYFLPEVPPTLSSLVLWPRCGRRHFGWRTMAWRVLNEQSSGRTQKSWWLRWTGVVLPYIYFFFIYNIYIYANMFYHLQKYGEIIYKRIYYL